MLCISNNWINVIKAILIFSFFLFLLIPADYSRSATAAKNLESLGKIGNNDLGLSDNLSATIGNVIKAILALVGMIFLILMVYAGMLWMTAGGAEEKIEKAQSIVTMAVIGVAIIMAAYAITAFVSGSLGAMIPTK
ncbi:MAG: hypothetical protein WCX97_04555 [Candidatus Magasanikbacteria bacterium]|jgi:hypothetical protein